jgi:hypothetical protein
MKLIKYENYQIEPTEEMFLVKAFRDMFNADKTKNKEKFMQQLSYIYFMYDPRSPYMYITDEDSRRKEIIKEEGLSEDFKPSDKMEKAISVYKELTTTASMRLLESMRVAVAKIGEFLEAVDLFAEDDKGRPKYNADRITAVADKIPQLAKRLQETEKLVAHEITDVARVRGGDDSDHAFERGFSFVGKEDSDE